MAPNTVMENGSQLLLRIKCDHLYQFKHKQMYDTNSCAHFKPKTETTTDSDQNQSQNQNHIVRCRARARMLCYGKPKKYEPTDKSQSKRMENGIHCIYTWRKLICVCIGVKCCYYCWLAQFMLARH